MAVLTNLLAVDERALVRRLLITDVGSYLASASDCAAAYRYIDTFVDDPPVDIAQSAREYTRHCLAVLSDANWLKTELASLPAGWMQTTAIDDEALLRLRLFLLDRLYIRLVASRGGSEAQAPLGLFMLTVRPSGTWTGRVNYADGQYYTIIYPGLTISTRRTELWINNTLCASRRDGHRVLVETNIDSLRVTIGRDVVYASLSEPCRSLGI